MIGAELGLFEPPGKMRNTGSFLDDDGRAEFGAWLDALRLTKGWTKREFLTMIGRDSLGTSARDANRYFEGRVAPTEETARKLAAAFRVDERLMLLRAGLLGSLLTDLPQLVQAAHEHCEAHGASFEACMVPGRRVARGRDGFMRFSLKGGTFSVPLSVLSAAFIAVAAFPLRGEKRKRTSVDPEEMLSAVATDFLVQGPPAAKPHELKRAAEILSDRQLPTEHRLAAAAEFVRAWFRAECGDFARACEAEYYTTSTLQSPFSANRTVTAKAKNRSSQR